MSLRGSVCYIWYFSNLFWFAIPLWQCGGREGTGIELPLLKGISDISTLLLKAHNTIWITIILYNQWAFLVMWYRRHLTHIYFLTPSHFTHPHTSHTLTLHTLSHRAIFQVAILWIQWSVPALVSPACLPVFPAEVRLPPSFLLPHSLPLPPGRSRLPRHYEINTAAIPLVTIAYISAVPHTS